MEIKRCSDCGRFLVENYFNWQNIKKNRRHSYCKKCQSNRKYLWKLDNPEYDKQYHKDNKEYKREYQRQWHENNPEYRKQWCRNNPEYQKQYREYNKEYFVKYQKQWQLDNPEYSKQHHEENKKYRNCMSQQWRKNNPDKVNACSAKRRIYKRNQTIFLTDLEKDKYNFIYKVASTMANYVVDHIQPVSKGGSDHPDNLQILRKDLNSEKFNKYPLTEEEEIKYIGFKL